MITEIRWRTRRRIAPLLSALLPGLGQALTARWGSALFFFAWVIIPVFFYRFIPVPVNLGHHIMLGLLAAVWVVNVLDAYLGGKPAEAPCIQACPARINIPSYVNLIVEKRFQDSHAFVLRWTPLVATIGHVCHHPCEAACTRNTFDEPVAICPLKAFVGARMIADGGLAAVPKPSPARRSPRVAVVGSGPAGLSAAFYMARLGLRPTIFEALPVAGGMLAVGIPSYRLPRSILEPEIDFIKNQGVEIRTGVSVGTDVSLDDLTAEGYRAVFLSPGTHREAQLRLEGEDTEGVVPGLVFLRRIALGDTTELAGEVVVVGGGNVAMDAARSALRLGASRVTVIYRRSRLEMPANDWEVREAEEEGVRFLFLTAPVGLLSPGNLSGVRCIQMRLGEPDQSGRRRPIPIEGSEFTLPCDHLIPAIGLVPGTDFLDGSGVRLRSSGLIVTRRGRAATHRKGLFAGGDAVTGPSSVIQASFHGRQAAAQIFSHLRGGHRHRFEKIRVGPSASDFSPRPRVRQNAEDPRARVGDFRQVHHVYEEPACLSEAHRCLRCDLNM